jgi:hypothetical protein
MGRLILFLTIGIVIGLVVGLVYTWVIDPGSGADVSPDSLRAEYKEEYVVMIALAYTTDSNLETARTQLATLKLVNPNQFLADLVDKKTKQGSSPDDLQALRAFAQALSSSSGSTP